MNIQTVIANLLNTIEGKEKLLREFTIAANELEGVEHHVAATMREMVKLNLQELNTILADCIAVREADIVRDLELKDAQRKAQQAHSDAAWQRDWDRQQAETNEGKWI